MSTLLNCRRASTAMVRFSSPNNDPFMFGSGRGGESVDGTLDKTGAMISTRGATRRSCVGRGASAACREAALRLIVSERCAVPVAVCQVVCYVVSPSLRYAWNRTCGKLLYVRPPKMNIERFALCSFQEKKHRAICYMLKKSLRHSDIA